MGCTCSIIETDKATRDKDLYSVTSRFSPDFDVLPRRPTSGRLAGPGPGSMADRHAAIRLDHQFEARCPNTSDEKPLTATDLMGVTKSFDTPDWSLR